MTAARRGVSANRILFLRDFEKARTVPASNKVGMAQVGEGQRQGLVRVVPMEGAQATVSVTERGRTALAAEGARNERRWHRAQAADTAGLGTEGRCGDCRGQGEWRQPV